MALRHILKKAGSPFNFLKKAWTPARATASSAVGGGNHSLTGHKKNLSTSSLGSTRDFSLTARMKSDHVLNIQDESDFKKRVLNSKVPIVIDFYATWCGPCKLLVPKLEQLVAKKNGEVMLAKIDIDGLTEIADSYEVTAVPTVIAMKNGKQVGKFVGLKDDAELESFINKLIH